MKRKLLLIVLLLFIVSMVNSQSVSQIGFIIKKIVPSVKEIVVLVADKNKGLILRQAKMAQVITKKKFSVYAISKKMDIIKKTRMISKKKNIAVFIVTDDNFFTTKIVKSISDKLNPKNIPLFSNRDKDTMVGAMVAIYKKDGNLEKHVNLITASILKITIPAEFLKKCVIDVE